MKTTRPVRLIKLSSTRSRVLTSVCGVFSAAICAILFVAASPQGKYAAHEWGTFTSVQGGDGKLLNWRPLQSSRLPGFVYSLGHDGLGRLPTSALTFSKGAMMALQR